MMNFRLVLVVCACALLASCSGKDATKESSKGQAPASPGGKSAELILGKWESAKGKDVWEYGKDGTLKMYLAGKDEPLTTGKYTFEDEGTITVEFQDSPDSSKKITEKLKITVTQDELTTTDSKGVVDNFKRKK